MKITFHLEQPTRRHWTDSPSSRRTGIVFCLALLRTGFTLPRMLPSTR